MKKTLRMASALALFALFVGCSSDKAPAEAAVKAAQSAAELLQGEDVTRYAADNAKAVQDALSAAKDKLAQKDYKGALAAAQPIPDKVKEVVAAGAAKKDELTRGWQELASVLPATLGRLELRVEALSQSEALPPSLDAGKLAEAKAAVDAVEDTWAKARGEFAAGAIAQATATATEVATKARELTTLLGAEPPAVGTPAK